MVEVVIYPFVFEGREYQVKRIAYPDGRRVVNVIVPDEWRSSFGDEVRLVEREAGNTVPIELGHIYAGFLCYFRVKEAPTEIWPASLIDALKKKVTE